MYVLHFAEVEIRLCADFEARSLHETEFILLRLQTPDSYPQLNRQRPRPSRKIFEAVRPFCPFPLVQGSVHIPVMMPPSVSQVKSFVTRSRDLFCRELTMIFKVAFGL